MPNKTIFTAILLTASTTVNAGLSFTQAPDNGTTDSYALFEFSNSGSSAHCAYDDEPAQPCSSPFALTWVKEGTHQLTITNESGAQITHHWSANNVMTTEGAEHDGLDYVSDFPDYAKSNSWRGIFRTHCEFSHSSYDDPIVYPGQEGAAHLHRFYSNTAVNHSTDTASLISTGDGSCQGGKLNRSSYWLPALLAPTYNRRTGEKEVDQNGETAWQVVPAVTGSYKNSHEMFYYSSGVTDNTTVQPIPPGLKMVAGNHMTMPGEQQDTSVVRWHCQDWLSSDWSNPHWSATIPECKQNDRVRADIFFPSCWDGINLDSDNHKSHMAYPVADGGLKCPDSHPVPIARVSFHYAFGARPKYINPETKTTTGWRLASDMYTVTADQAGGLSLHSDFFNGWHMDIMEAFVKNCINGGLDCLDGNLGNGLRLADPVKGPGYEPEIVNEGMGDYQ